MDNSQNIVNYPQFVDYKIGVLIAGNAGRPGGGIMHPDGSGFTHAGISIDREYRTQEESLVMSWLRAERLRNTHFDPSLCLSLNLGNKVQSEGGVDCTLAMMNPDPYSSTVGDRPWGMKNPPRTDTETLQGIDFTVPLNIGTLGSHTVKYDFAYILKDKPLLSDTSQSKLVDLIFVYGPNIGYSGRELISTARRTRISEYQFVRDYGVFYLCVKQSLRSGLIKMIENNDDIAILCGVSAGIYSGRGGTRERINEEYPQIISEVLKEDYDGSSIGSKFTKIILAKGIY